MSVVFYNPTGMPMVMNPSNFNLCAVELERVVDSLKAQFSAATPGSREATVLLERVEEHIEVLDAFRLLATLRNGNAA